MTDAAVGAGTTRPVDGRLGASDFREPAILLSGVVDQDMYRSFREQLANAGGRDLVVLELSTVGGDPEFARMIGDDVRFHRDLDLDRRFVFLGKAVVYSAGATLMSYFDPTDRYLVRGARLMIHERKLDENLRLSGPMSGCLHIVRAKLHEIETAIRIQNEGFANLARGSKMSLDDIIARAPANWYLDAQEALELGLVSGVI